MSTGLHTLKNTNTRSKARVGRGGKRGKTSGRGMKGQKARAGGSPRPEERDIIKKLPKRRGFGKNRARTVHDARPEALPVSLAVIDAAYNDGETVSLETLHAKGLIETRGNKYPAVKILANGELKTRVTVAGLPASATAKAAIEKAGGTVQPNNQTAKQPDNPATS